MQAVQPQTRTSKSLKNVLIGLIGLSLNLIFQFVSRSVFIYLLGAEYNGVNGLFTNVLQILSIAELGFAYSVAFALYKPLSTGDEQTVSAIMNYFAKIYRVIALIVLIAGCICIPFLQYLIADDLSALPFELNELRVYFCFYLANTVSSYLLAYKRTIVTADQNAYIVSNVDNIGSVILYIIQIVLLFIFKNYYVFLTCMIVKTVSTNVVITLISNKKYPYLRKYSKLKINNAERREIIKYVEASFCHRIGGVAIYGTTSVIISAFVSLVEAGMYSNYIMIVNGVTMLVDMIFNSVTASVGNLCVGSDDGHKFTVFRRVSYVSNFISVFAMVCFMCLFNPFVLIWLKNADMCFNLLVVGAISLSASITFLRKSVNMFKDAQGLFKKDWFKPLIEAGAGVALAICLSRVWGTFGVIAGYAMSTLFIAVPIETFVLFKFGLKKSFFIQMLYDAGTLVFGAILTLLCLFICSYLPQGTLWFLLRGVICIAVSAGAYVLFTFTTDEFKYFVRLAGKILKKIFRKKTSA